MKTKKNATLRKLGMILAVALLFSALTVPVWADGEGDTQPNPDNTVAADSTADAQPVEPVADTQPTEPEVPPVAPQEKAAVGSTAQQDDAPPAGSDNTGNGSDSGASSKDLSPAEQALASGSITITGYTATDAAGKEIQRIEVGQKCCIIISVVDTRIVPGTKAGEKTSEEIDRDVAINVKVTSTASFATPSLGDIKTTALSSGRVSENGAVYAIILNDITYLGGDNKLSLDIGYSGYTFPLPITKIEQPISQCADASAEGTKDSALVLTSASYGGGSVEAGQDFTLTVDVLAPDKYAGAENVKVIITPPEQFTSASGSTMVYVGDLKPGATRQVTFQLNASATAQSGSYAIAVNVTGTSMANGAAAPSDQMSVTVPITQPERFEISRTDLPEYLSMGEEGYASVSFVNKGKGTIYNVSAEITGEGITTTEGNLYVGNVASGTESSADFTIQTSQSGTLSAVLTVTYEDEKGNVKELTKDFSMTVEEMNMGGDDMGFDPGFDPMPMPEEPQGMPVWGWILIGVGVLAVGGGAAFVIIKKKKAKKKAAQLTEDDDEDI